MATNYNSKQLAKIYSDGVVVERLSLRPINLELTKNISGKNILDLGCGDGRYSIIFAKRGARVIAIDSSENQINIAKNKNSHKNISYSIRSGTSLSFIKNKSIDLVFMNLVISDVDKKSNLEKIFKGIKRVLKPKGKFIFSTLHPLYLSSEQDFSDKPINFKKENYFRDGSLYDSEAFTKSGKKITFTETHFSLNYISKLLEKNNFVIHKIRESNSVISKGIYLPKYIVFQLLFR